VLDLDCALSELGVLDAQKCQVAELRFFAGLSLEEIGHALGLSVATAEREWQAARAWLYARLNGRLRRNDRARTKSGRPNGDSPDDDPERWRQMTAIFSCRTDSRADGALDPGQNTSRAVISSPESSYPTISRDCPRGCLIMN
jgi:hypothetical protein